MRTRLAASRMWHWQGTARACWTRFKSTGLPCSTLRPPPATAMAILGATRWRRCLPELFGTEAAMVRPHIASGTHALSLCLFGLLLPGDELVYASGAPYDTLRGVIGMDGGTNQGRWREMGVGVSASGAKRPRRAGPCGHPRFAITPHTRVVAVQRSRGYSARRSHHPHGNGPAGRYCCTRECPRMPC